MKFKNIQAHKKSLFSNSITILFIIFLVWYFANNKQDFKDLTNIPVWAFASLLFIKGIRIFINGLFTKYTLKAFGKHISVSETNRISLLSAMGNFFGPILGGAGIRAVYLKKNHDFQYSNFISTLYAYYLISFLSNSILAVILMVYTLLTQGVVPGSILMTSIFLGIFILCAGLILLPSHFTRKIFIQPNFVPARIKNIFSNIIDGWELMRRNRQLIKELIILSMVLFIFGVITSYILFYLFVDNYTVVGVLLYTLIGTLALLINITPGAIGIKEGLYLFTSAIIIITPAEILQMSIIDRASTFILLGLLFVVLKVYQLKSSKSLI